VIPKVPLIEAATMGSLGIRNPLPVEKPPPVPPLGVYVQVAGKVNVVVTFAFVSDAHKLGHVTAIKTKVTLINKDIGTPKNDLPNNISKLIRNQTSNKKKEPL